MTRFSRSIVVALAAIALGASIASLYVHYQLLADPSYSSFCDISETVSCEAVYQSAYGSVFGVPVAAGGAIWAALALLLGLVGWRDPKSEAGMASTGYLFALSTIGVAVVLYFAYASFLVLNRTCILCVTVYIAVAGIFLLSGSAESVPLSSLPARLGRDLRQLRGSSLAVALTLIWLVGSASLVAFFPRQAPQAAAGGAASTVAAAPTEVLEGDQLTQFQAWVEAQPRVPIQVPAGDARVVVVKFNDYQCPACKQTYVEYKGIFEKYAQTHPGEVLLVMKDFPLDAECNVGSIHASACEAAAGVRMAREVNRGEAFEEWLFDNQASLTPDLVKQGLQEVAQVTDFDARYADALTGVREDAALGMQLAIDSTPTFFINGIRIKGGLRPSYLDALIAYELQRTSGAAPQGDASSD